jgi:hypothetical protein
VKYRLLFRAIDQTFFFGKVSALRNTTIKRRFRFYLKHDYKRAFMVYSKNSSKLAALCDLYGSDKGSNLTTNHPYPWDAHCYSDFYELLFSKKEGEIGFVFECGIGTSNSSFPANMGADGRPGASLRVWRDYFPNAFVYGADIDHGVLFKEERIETFYMNQLDPISIKSATQRFTNGMFDLMVDDGLHTFEAALTLFLNCSRLLSPRGIYVIEDVTPKSMSQLLMPGVIPDSFETYPVTFHEVGKSQELNSLLVITRVSRILEDVDQG